MVIYHQHINSTVTCGTLWYQQWVMYRGDKEEGPEQIPGVHRVLESTVLTYSHWPEQTACATSGMTDKPYSCSTIYSEVVTQSWWQYRVIMSKAADKPNKRSITDSLLSIAHRMSFWTLTQLYISFRTDCSYDLSLAKRRVECCVNDIDCWMVNNGLKLNQDKTELVLISSKFRCRPSLEFIQVVDERIQPKPSARNLGVIIDQCLDLTDHVNKICISSQYHL